MNSALVQVPTVIGWLRPVVLLPVSCFTGLPQAQIEAILCHELAHIRRHDYVVSIIQAVVEALLFYHPAVWWVSRQVRHERECCCDDMAVAVGGDALAYARALTTLAQRTLYPPVMAKVVLGANGGILTMRIKRLLIAETTSAASQVAAAAVVGLLILSTIAIAGTARAEAGSPLLNPPPVATQQPIASPLPTAHPSATHTQPIMNTIMASKTAPQISTSGTHEDLFAAASPAVAPALAQQQAESSPARIRGDIVAGQIVYKTQPIYPEEAKAAHIEGAVRLHAIISKTGDVDSLQVLSGPPELCDSAIDAVRQWKYKPYLLNGEPIEVDTTITVNYSFAP